MTQFAPMLASAVRQPFDSAAYLFEVKWDGIRCLCKIDGAMAHLFSRTGRDITRLFPEMQRIPDALAARSAVLDGELCVLDGRTPSFHYIQRRNVLSADVAIRTAALEHPALYVVFDLLHIDGVDLLELPLAERRRRLEDVWRGTEHATLSTAVYERGRDLYAASVAQGLEGIVAKRLDSPYVPGRRTRHWLKVRHQRELDGVICGYTPRRDGDFASLAIGLYAKPVTDAAAASPTKRPLTYIGNVGAGFSEQARRDIMARLLPLKTASPPFMADPGTSEALLPTDSHLRRIPTDTQWVRPQLVCRVGYLQFTPRGHLRHSTFLGLRDDKRPYECTWNGADRESAEQQKVPEGE